jgi:hypothetical protein
MLGQSAIVDCLIDDATDPVEENMRLVLGYSGVRKSRGNQ